MKPKLTADEREFFGLVARAAFANPFGPEREALDLRLTGLPSGTPGPRVIERLLALVGDRLAALERAGKLGPATAAAAGEDLRRAILFDAYHRSVGEFDGHIAAQAAAGDEALPVPFARATLALLAGRGFTAAEAERYFAIFFQFRRAYYFIRQRLTGAGPAVRQLRMRLWQNVFTADPARYDRSLWNRMEHFSTLLIGETGTGKGTAAAAIGGSGFIPWAAKRGRFAESFTATFIAINLAQFPATLLESELFGHRQGAFTGAVEDYRGLLAGCSPHGSIFLDEIGDLSVPAQLKLLRVLEEREFSPLGSHARVRFAGRIVAATNRPPGDLLRPGALRPDFYYRLCSDVIEVPPLRQRLAETPAELELLLRHIVGKLTGAAADDIVEPVLRAIRRDLGPEYPWPGNVRELEQCVRRILLTGAYHPAPAAGDDGTALARALAAGELTAAGLLARYAALLQRRYASAAAVARRLGVDRRTAAKYLAGGNAAPPPDLPPRGGKGKA